MQNSFTYSSMVRTSDYEFYLGLCLNIVRKWYRALANNEKERIHTYPYFRHLLCLFNITNQKKIALVPGTISFYSTI